jgi:hypothetical protein
LNHVPSDTPGVRAQFATLAAPSIEGGGSGIRTHEPPFRAATRLATEPLWPLEHPAEIARQRDKADEVLRREVMAAL